MSKTKTTVKSKVKTAAGTASVPKSKQERDQIVRQAIMEARDQIETSYLDLAANLYEAYHREYYSEKWGFQTWEEYCSAELDTPYRKSMYLIEIWDKVKALKLPQAKVNALGWSKMKDLVAVLTAENAKEWMEKAKKMSSRELTEAVKIVRKSDSSGVDLPTIATMTFRMSESEASVITDAIEAAKRLCETENAVVALEMVCQDWLEEKGQQPERASLDDHINFLQDVYGVNITYTAVGEKAGKTEKAGKGKKAGKAKEPEKTEGSDDGEGEQDINALLGIS